MFVTAFVGFFLALPMALLAAWRARLLRWWPALAVTSARSLLNPSPEASVYSSWRRHSQP
jgi:hypothetical protein